MFPTTHPRVDELKQILRESTARPETDQNSLLISIDFGATYTGVAYVFTSAPDTILQITDWPNRANSAPKVPSLLLYESPNSVSWGYQVSPTDPKRIEGFRQLIDPSLPKPLHVTYPKVQTELKARGKDAFSATVAFFKSLNGYIMPYIESKHSDAFASVLSIKFVLPFPAGWPTDAKRLIEEAAHTAGLRPIMRTVEKPTAAAIYALAYANLRSAELQVGDNFSLCRAGGGLVDVISYKIKKISPLEIDQLVPPTAGTGGSMMLNKGFENYLQGVIDEGELIQLKKTQAYSTAMKEFEDKVKRNYSLTGPATYHIAFPGARLTPDPGMNLQSSSITLTSENLKAIFQSVVTEVSDMIKAQLRSVELKFPNQQDAAVKCIILVGGLGSNKYLHESLKKDLPKFQILQPEYAWTAVNRGSLIRHLPPTRSPFARTKTSIPRRVRKIPTALKSYGIQSSPVFDRTKHGDLGERYWDPWESVERVKGVVWFISKGDDISRPRRIPLSFHKECPPRPETGEASIDFEICESTRERNVGSWDTNLATTLTTTVSIPLSLIPLPYFNTKTRRSDGETYWDLPYRIVIDVEDMVLKVWIEVGEVGRAMEGPGGMVKRFGERVFE